MQAYCNKLDLRKITHLKNVHWSQKKVLRHDSIIHLLIQKVDDPQRTLKPSLWSCNSDKFGHLVPFSKTQERQKGGGENDRQKRTDKDSPLRNIS